ncbi:MAG: 4-alpha-glucanotransferase [Candidatus Omnitrophota bacterium]
MDIKQQEQFLFLTASKDKWRSLGVKRRAGILTPLFSIYSKNSVGIGDFSDLKLLIDFSKKTGNSILQLLPMNEVGGTYCPYDSISSFALEPMYLSLNNINFSADALHRRDLASGGKNKKIVSMRVNNLKKKYPLSSGQVNYQIKQAKLDLLWEIFFDDGTVKEKDLDKFIEENNYWLDDFTLYKVLKRYHGYKAWFDWPDEFKERDKKALEKFIINHKQEIDFEIWLQYILFKQFKAVKAYALKNKVFLKGDLPILVSKDSADVWAHRNFFKLEFASGAPPDMYAAKGQRWGMPTHNWQNIKNDNYLYLINKLKYAENFYDILRIDHVVGLFRIWSIPSNDPLENKGLNGFFDPKDESSWYEHGKDILSTIINNTSMLVCAEDLGVIPKACPEALKELGVCGNDVSRWAKDWVYKHDFLNPDEYRFLSVSMLSTHDTTNFCAWWKYEAGTVDEGLFIRKCIDRGINFESVKYKLFDFKRSHHGRLRWLDEINSIDILLWNLGKPKSEVEDFIELYQNSYREKENLWRHLEIQGKMQEEATRELIERMMNFILKSNSIFSIQLLIDWLYLENIFKEDCYGYRINTPGTVNQNNWSITLPLSLEELIDSPISKKIKELINLSNRL